MCRLVEFVMLLERQVGDDNAVNADLFFSDDACIIKAIIVLSQNEPDIWIDTVACQICGKFQGMTVTAPMTPSARQRLYIIIEESTYND